MPGPAVHLVGELPGSFTYAVASEHAPAFVEGDEVEPAFEHGGELCVGPMHVGTKVGVGLSDDQKPLYRIGGGGVNVEMSAPARAGRSPGGEVEDQAVFEKSHRRAGLVISATPASPKRTLPVRNVFGPSSMA